MKKMKTIKHLCSIFALIIALSAQTFAALQSRALACNGYAALCDRHYNDVVHLGAHDSPFVANKSNGYNPFGNQFFDSIYQLNHGVRMLTAQIHQASNGELHLCHTSCQYYDVGSLLSWLQALRAWLQQNPHEVVTILIVNDGSSATTLDSIFRGANITQYGYVPPSKGTPPAKGVWPTLRTLINADKRLLVFMAPLDPAQNTVAPYLMNEDTFLWSNPYQVTNPQKFSCEPQSPPSVAGSYQKAFASHRLAIMNHFLDKQLAPGIYIPARQRAWMTNAPLGSPNASTGSLGTWSARCRSLWGRKPTYLIVDWYNHGPAIATVNHMNGVGG